MISGIRYHYAALPAVRFNAGEQKPKAHKPATGHNTPAISLEELKKLPLTTGVFGLAVILRNRVIAGSNNKPA
jgi:hypothetical protein